MLQTASRNEPQASRKLSVSLATGADQVREAQKLRYRVFVEEMGARLTTPADHDSGSPLPEKQYENVRKCRCDHDAPFVA